MPQLLLIPNAPEYPPMLLLFFRTIKDRLQLFIRFNHQHMVILLPLFLALLDLFHLVLLKIQHLQARLGIHNALGSDLGDFVITQG
jgi:hypothetical protein